MEKDSEYTREYKKQGLVPILDWKAMPMKRKQQKISRNAPCPCGSGKKYKQCCLKN